MFELMKPLAFRIEALWASANALTSVREKVAVHAVQANLVMLCSLCVPHMAKGWQKAEDAGLEGSEPRLSL